MPDRQLNTGRQLLLNLLWFAFNFQTAALLPVVIPAQVLLIVSRGSVANAQQAAYLGWLAAGAAVLGLVLMPLVGFLSDRTRSRWGRRRPHIVWGTAIMLLGAAGLARAGSSLTFALAFLVLQVGNAAAIAAYQGLLPDLVPRSQRGSASGYLGLMTILGNAASLGLAAFLLSSVTAGQPGAIVAGAARFYSITIVVVALSCLATAVGVAEPSTDAPIPGKGRQLPASLRSWLDPWRSHNFAWVFAARFLVIMGLTLFLTFVEYYFARVVHSTNFVQDTAAVALIALLVAVIGALALGLVSDRTRRVPLAFASTLVMAIAAVMFLLGGGTIPLWWLGATFGLGYGAYWSVDWALAVDSLPVVGADPPPAAGQSPPAQPPLPRAAGRDLGLWSLASTLPSMAAPAMGGLIIGAGAALGTIEAGYQAVFVAAAVFFLLGAVAVLGIREETATPVVAREEQGTA